MKFSRWLLLGAAAPLVVAGCDNFGRAMTAHTDVVARAAGKELKVDEAVQLLAANPQIPADPQVVRALADIWVDYTLLATAAAEDPTLAAVDLEKFTQAAREQMTVFKLRQQVIQPDTSFTDEEVLQRWASEGPGAEIRARHILLRIPAEATPAQRDSVRQLAESLRAQAAGGADFAALASQYSQDPGSAERGGDLGFFGRGRMVAPFEEAAFGLKEGEVSQVVESPFGYHIIRVEERRQTDLEPQRQQFRQFLVQRAEQDAETAYLDSLSASANVQVTDGGLAVVRELAAQPDVVLRGRAARREIATFEGGSLTSGEFAEFIRTQPPHIQAAFPTATDEQLEGVVKQLARKELLLREAERRQVTLTPAEQDSLRTQARQAINNVVASSGFANAGTSGGAGAAAIDARVREVLQGAINGTRQLVPLGPLAFSLREAYGAEINESTFSQVVEKLEQVRASQGVPANPGAPVAPGTPPGAAPGAAPGNQPAAPAPQPRQP